MSRQDDFDPTSATHKDPIPDSRNGQSDLVPANRPGDSSSERLAAELSFTCPSQPKAEESAFPQIEGYEVLGRIGEGGMGTVYKARNIRLDRFVALKVLSGRSISNPRAGVRFEREMKAVGRICHPNIIQALDARDVEGRIVLVMEFADGLDLGEVVRRRGPLRVADACEIVRQTALGLQAIHDNGMVHRDVKPSNLMLTMLPSLLGKEAGCEGVVKILDLGLALLRTDQPAGDECTSADSALGTADYMAPEQASHSHSVDIRADIYSLGCTLYNLLTGRAPFSGPEYQSTTQKMFAHLQAAVPSVTQARSDMPAGLTELLDRMLDKDPAARFATPAKLAEAIAPFCEGAALPALFSARDQRSLASTVSYSEFPSPSGRVAGGRDRSILSRLFSPRFLIAAAVVLALGTSGVVAWKCLPVGGPAPVAVQESILFVRRGGDDNKIEKLILTGSHNGSEPGLNPLGPKDDFKFHAELNRPTYWYLAWLDTKGIARVVARCEAPEKVVDYPPGNALVGIDPQDPAGVHLILVLVSDFPPREIEPRLQQSLAGVGPPSVVPGPNMLLGLTRGPGSVQSSKVNLDARYLRRVEGRLPATVRWVHQLYLPVQR